MLPYCQTTPPVHCKDQFPGSGDRVSVYLVFANTVLKWHHHVSSSGLAMSLTKGRLSEVPIGHIYEMQTRSTSHTTNISGGYFNFTSKLHDLGAPALNSISDTINMYRPPQSP